MVRSSKILFNFEAGFFLDTEVDQGTKAVYDSSTKAPSGLPAPACLPAGRAVDRARVCFFGPFLHKQKRAFVLNKINGLKDGQDTGCRVCEPLLFKTRGKRLHRTEYYGLRDLLFNLRSLREINKDLPSSSSIQSGRYVKFCLDRQGKINNQSQPL